MEEFQAYQNVHSIEDPRERLSKKSCSQLVITVVSENTDEVLNKIYIVLDETSLGPTLAVIQHFYC